MNPGRYRMTIPVTVNRVGGISAAWGQQPGGGLGNVTEWEDATFEPIPDPEPDWLHRSGEMLRYEERPGHIYPAIVMARNAGGWWCNRQGCERCHDDEEIVAVWRAGAVTRLVLDEPS